MRDEIEYTGYFACTPRRGDEKGTRWACTRV